MGSQLTTAERVGIGFTATIPIALTVLHADRFAALAEGLGRAIEAEARATLYRRLARALRARAAKDAEAASEVRAEAERMLAAWAAIPRDELVRMAVQAGVPKARVHALTGIARTTIDRILRSTNG